MDAKFGTLQQVQTHLEEMDPKLVKHAETMEQMQVKVNLSMEALGKVQAEQNRVSSSLKGAVVTPLTIPEQDSQAISGAPPDRFPPQPVVTQHTTACVVWKSLT
jgi:hypothetical protein